MERQVDSICKQKTVVLLLLVVITSEAPSLTDIPSDETKTIIPEFTVIGNTVTLKCSIPMSRPAKVTWVDLVYNRDIDPQQISNGDLLFNNHPNLLSYSLESNFSLSISDVKLEDVGEYRCISWTKDGGIHSIVYYLAVMGQPQCHGVVSLMETEKTTLICETIYSGNYHPSVAWHRNGKVIPTGDVEDLFDIRLAKLSLDIQPTYEDDGATFSCPFKFGNIEKECSLTLNVTFPVRDLTIFPLQESYRVGEEVRCSAKGNPVPEVSIRPAAKSETFGHGWKSVTIPEEVKGQTYELQCTAWNYIEPLGQITLSQNISFSVVEAKLPSTTNKPTADAHPKSAAVLGTSGAIVSGIIVGAVILVIIVVAVVCVRMKKEKKPPKGVMFTGSMPAEENGSKKLSIAERDSAIKRDKNSRV